MHFLRNLLNNLGLSSILISIINVTLLACLTGCTKQRNIVDFKTKEAFFSSEQTNASLTETEKSEALRIPTKLMNFAQAKYAKDYFKNADDKFMHTKCCERILALSGDQETACKTTLELAQISLDEGEYAKAQKYASLYQNLYPGSEDIEKASYINIKAHFLDTLNAERDQSKTSQTIELAKNFIKNNDLSDYTDTVKEMLESCYQKLIISELNVAQTYLNRFNYSGRETSLAAAQARLDYVRRELLPQAEFTEGLLLNAEIKLASARKDMDKVKSKKHELDTKYPNGIPQLASNKDQNLMQKIKDYFLS